MNGTTTPSPAGQLHASCIYEGTVDHCRLAPARNAFRYRIFMMYLDLDELPRLFERRWLWSATRAAPARFRRSDYPGDPSEPLDRSIRAIVKAETGSAPAGPVRLLTHLRYFGYGFNPASFFYCFDADGERVEAIVVHVTNTPWGESHCYVVTPCAAAQPSDPLIATRRKKLHVSPFLPMDLDHEFRFGVPGRELDVRMVDYRRGRRVFSAHLALERREITGRALAGVLARHPAMTWRVIAGIYAQALRLYWKGTPFHSHPKPLPTGQT
ncbi:MAG: DUF1365 domain-containing protein [Candidatus Binatia bacterium]